MPRTPQKKKKKGRPTPTSYNNNSHHAGKSTLYTLPSIAILTTQLIILSGYPSSGLTHRATQLATLLQKTQDDLFASGAIDPSRPRYKIATVPTHDASHPRSVYDNARTEKMARGVAYARAKRALGKDTFVILDGMNYIKGYRYQLWCEAKAVGTTCCVVSILLSGMGCERGANDDG